MTVGELKAILADIPDHAILDSGCDMDNGLFIREFADGSGRHGWLRVSDGAYSKFQDPAITTRELDDYCRQDGR